MFLEWAFPAVGVVNVRAAFKVLSSLWKDLQQSGLCTDRRLPCGPPVAARHGAASPCAGTHPKEPEGAWWAPSKRRKKPDFWPHRRASSGIGMPRIARRRSWSARTTSIARRSEETSNVRSVSRTCSRVECSGSQSRELASMARVGYARLAQRCVSRNAVRLESPYLARSHTDTLGVQGLQGEPLSEVLWRHRP